MKKFKTKDEVVDFLIKLGYVTIKDNTLIITDKLKENYNYFELENKYNLLKEEYKTLSLSSNLKINELSKTRSSVTGKDLKFVFENMGFKDWIKTWVKLFPTSKRNTVTGKTGLEQRMLKFVLDNLETLLGLLKYDYKGVLTKNQLLNDPSFRTDLYLTIDKATKKYLSEVSNKNYMYCKEAQYFILKAGESSKLLSYCEQVLDNSQVKTNSDSWITFI
jgi:hypothetical protein